MTSEPHAPDRHPGRTKGETALALLGLGLALAGAILLALGGPWQALTVVVALGIILLVFGLFGRRLHAFRFGLVAASLLPEGHQPGPSVVHRDRAPGPKARGQADPGELSAQYPTLEHALAGVPATWDRWTEDRDGHDYIHLRSPHGAFEIMVSHEALDGPAPQWFLLAIDSMD